jgi:phosphoglycerate dehydrogenase-like enzyme
LRKTVLVASRIIGEPELSRLAKNARVFSSWKMDESEIEAILPEIDVLIVSSWPSFLDKNSLPRMKRLKFMQSILVGVDHIPFRDLPENVTVASNAGAYSSEVAEHAWGLILAAEKKIVEHDAKIREGAKALGEFADDASEIGVLRGKTIGIVGYGGIGRAVSDYAEAFGMKVLAFGRNSKKSTDRSLLTGSQGLNRLLRQSDVVLLSIPLTQATLGLIGGRELSTMKENATLVNVARGDLVNQRALYDHLKSHPGFKYATDAWWYKNGHESLETDYPFASLKNFIGTPHTSGPTSVHTGRPGALAADNVLLYLGGKVPKNLVNGREYVGMSL